MYWQRLNEIRAEKTYPVDAPRGTYERSYKLEGFEPTFPYVVHTFEKIRNVVV